jgi:tetratricopeptide (TPR) repeat protein
MATGREPPRTRYNQEMHPPRRRLLVGFISTLLLLILLGFGAYYFQGAQQIKQAEAALAADLPLEAAQHYERAAGYFPWRPGLWELGGRYALQAGDSQAAIRLLEEADRQGSLSPKGSLVLGDAYYNAGDTPSAEIAWQRALAAGVPVEERIQRLVQASLDQKDYPTAIETLKIWVDKSPQDAGLLYRLGLLTATQDPEAALEYLSRAEEIDESFQSEVTKIQRAVVGARYAEDPAYSLVAAGRALGALDEWGPAAQAFRNATLARPDYAEAWAYLGEALQHQPDQEDVSTPESISSNEGLAELRKALTLDPKSLAAHTLMAMYWSRRGSYDQALEYMQNAVDLDPQNPLLHIELANAFAQAGDMQSAYNSLEQAVTLAPEDPAILRQFVDFLLRYNYQLEQVALPVARRLVILEPEEPANLDSMAQLLIQLGDLNSAERFLGRALQADADYAPAHLHLGLVYVLKDERQAALNEFRLASSLDPGGAIAMQAQRMLETYFP